MPKRPLKRASDLSREFQKDPAYAALYREAVNKEIGATLRTLRETKGMSQRDVGEAMGGHEVADLPDRGHGRHRPRPRSS